jgi:hypothetical protein
VTSAMKTFRAVSLVCVFTTVAAVRPMLQENPPTTTTDVTVPPPPPPSINPSLNILFRAQLLPTYTPSRFVLGVRKAFAEPSFNVIYTVPFQPASGFVEFFFDPEFPAAVQLAHRLYVESTGNLETLFGVRTLSGRPINPNCTTTPTNYATTSGAAPVPPKHTTLTFGAPKNFTTTRAPAPENFTTTRAPAPENFTSTRAPAPENFTSTRVPAPPIALAANILFNATFIPDTYSARSFSFEVSNQFNVRRTTFRVVYSQLFQPASRFAQFFFDPAVSGYAAAAELAHRLYAQSADDLAGVFGVQYLTGMAMPVPDVNLEFTGQVNLATFNIAEFGSCMELWLGASNSTQLVIDSLLALRPIAAEPVAQRRRALDDAPIAVVKFHFAGPDAIAVALRFANLTAQQLSDFKITSLVTSPYVAPPTPAPPSPPATEATTPPPPTLPAPTQLRAYVPSWNNIEFNGIFASPADSSRLQAHVTAWARVWLGDVAATIEADQIGTSQQSWHFTGPNGTRVGHAFYAQTDDELMDRFGIQSFTTSWIIPQSSGFSGTDNLEFTLTFANFEEASFRAALAQLFGITDVDDLELSITRGRTLVNGRQVIQCEFWGPNAVIDAHQLLAVPQSALDGLGIISRSASVIQPPPAPEDGASRLHWVLSGVVVFDGVCICCAVRRKRRLCSCGDVGTITGSDRRIAYRRLN